MTAKRITTSWPELTAILLARLGFLWLLVFVSLLMPNDGVSFHAFMGIAFIVTIPYSLWLRSKLRTAQFAPLQFLVDLALVTGLVYFTGGVRSDLTLLYPLVILSAGIVGTPRQAVHITALGMVAYLLLATLLSQGLLTAYLPADNPPAPRAATTGLFLRMFTFALFGAVSVYIAKRCTYIDARERDTATTLSTVFYGMPAPLLMLDPDGRILMANDAACATLQTTEDALARESFASLCVQGRHPVPESFGPASHLRRPDDPPLPVAYRKADIRLPGSAWPGSGGRKNDVLASTLLSFSDLSRPLELQRQLEKVERITAATRIAGEMAHEIRTPLTALSASIQLLRHYEERASAADWLPNSPRRRDRRELFDHIEDASRQMDAVVQNFVSFAEFSPRELLTIIKLDSTPEKQGYIGHPSAIKRGCKNGQDPDSGRRSNDP